MVRPGVGSEQCRLHNFLLSFIHHFVGGTSILRTNYASMLGLFSGPHRPQRCHATCTVTFTSSRKLVGVT